MRATQINTLLRLGFARGFRASSEGWNAEYPFGDRAEDFTFDEEWINMREDNLADLFRKERSKL